MAPNTTLGGVMLVDADMECCIAARLDGLHPPLGDEEWLPRLGRWTVVVEWAGPWLEAETWQLDLEELEELYPGGGTVIAALDALEEWLPLEGEEAV